MFMLTDWMLIITSTLILISSYKKIIENRYSSTAHFIILIEYVFLCLPILLNYCFGIPTYQYIPWYKPFLSSMKNNDIAIIYDIYIMASVLILYSYAIFFDKTKAGFVEYKDIIFENTSLDRWLNKILIASPIIYIVLSGNLGAYLIYATSAARGLANSNFNIALSMLVLFSIYAFCRLFFAKPLTNKRLIILIMYSVVVSWINGKRFIIALLLLVYLFFYTRSDLNIKTRKKLAIYTPIFFSLLIIFSYYYLIAIKPLSDISFYSVYDMLRVDFGRDDVIKFVIEQEFFYNTPILDYRGQTFLSTFLTFVPREIWTDKAYPHYMYLTASILKLPINNLPAGTTPSWFEMCLANFSWLGFVIGIVIIPIFCYWCDRINSIPNKMLFLVFVMVLITQSTDAYVGFLMLLATKLIIYSVFGNKRIRLKI